MGSLNLVRISGKNSDTLSFSAARESNNTTDQYLRIFSNIPSNISPYIAPFDVMIKSIVLTTKIPSTCSVLLKKNGVEIEGTELFLNEQSLNTLNDINLIVTSGNKIQVYLKGSNISYPIANIFLERL